MYREYLASIVGGFAAKYGHPISAEALKVADTLARECCDLEQFYVREEEARREVMLTGESFRSALKAVVRDAGYHRPSVKLTAGRLRVACVMDDMLEQGPLFSLYASHEGRAFTLPEIDELKFCLLDEWGVRFEHADPGLLSTRFLVVDGKPLPVEEAVEPPVTEPIPG